MTILHLPSLVIFDTLFLSMAGSNEREREKLPEMKMFPPETTILVIERDPGISETMITIFIEDAGAKAVINCPDYSKVASAIKETPPSAMVVDTLTLVNALRPSDLVRENRVQPKIEVLSDRLRNMRLGCPRTAIILTGTSPKDLAVIVEAMKAKIGPLAYFARPFENHKMVEVVIKEIEKVAVK